MALEDDLSDQADHNNSLLQGMCLLELVNRREHHSGSTDPPIFGGLSLPRTTGPPFRTCKSVALAPSPTPCGEGTEDQDMFVDCAIPKDEAP
jgi:hypothetical protein